MKIPETLISKYNVPVPRYTSYPTVPFWEEKHVDRTQWLKNVKKTFNASNDENGISLYIHLPYCESLCTYCACNTRISKNHKVEDSYIDAVLAEWKIYCHTFGKTPVIREIHLGGGTPTFFTPENLQRLIRGILSDSKLHQDYAFSFEGHPNNTTYDHLKALYEVGFRRVSYGVQDMGLKVQKAINRVQPYENVKRATEDAREIGYTSVNFDLIYGLPFQTEAGVLDTMAKTLELKPERIAFYSYAHVPWKRPGQRAYTEADLPDSAEKRKLYESGKALLLANGYYDIGMDHFSLPGDDLYKAYQLKTLHRNFMGYTANHTDLLVGLGASAIGDASTAYAQNVKTVEEYKEIVAQGELPLEKGHFLTEEDILIKEFILNIACKGELFWGYNPDILDFNALFQLNSMAKEGLIKLYDNGMRLTDLGMAFLRNICAVFDKKLQGKKENNMPLFSKAI
ncbi:oxygen-independent coproporphyrinogen III oxidase [Fulvivirga sediminis]|uniref:Coproporphyrinogen-III oxidase n=1 Tax=Fulvivirga sediminis TaxID=2803949 RepID=A0A937F9P2_9BACT|nr:oxygen-independent coproporphyrinogen III oxidase [Fulvivirga sediminis]MBL3658265.1 oxygen-independent coproporphyrinogen III oxidase [Fulvivirga sediminis]